MQLCWPRYGTYYHIVGMGTVGWVFLFAINVAGSVDSKHRQKHVCRGQLTMMSSFMNKSHSDGDGIYFGYGMVWWGDDDQVIYVVTKDNTTVLMWSRS